MSRLGVITRRQTGTYAVTRTANGSYDANGRFTAGATSAINVVAIVQPLDPRTVLPLPEGVRSEDVRLVHTATLLRTPDGTGAADSISIGGEPYIVFEVAGPFTLNGATHYEIHAARRAVP